MDVKKEESHQTQLKIQQNGGSIVPEIGDHEDFMAEIEDPNPPIHQVCVQSAHGKVNFLPKNELSSLSLTNNTVIRAIDAYKEEYHVVSKVFDERPRSNTFSCYILIAGYNQWEDYLCDTTTQYQPMYDDSGGSKVDIQVNDWSENDRATHVHDNKFSKNIITNENATITRYMKLSDVIANVGVDSVHRNGEEMFCFFMDRCFIHHAYTGSKITSGMSKGELGRKKLFIFDPGGTIEQNVFEYRRSFASCVPGFDVLRPIKTLIVCGFDIKSIKSVVNFDITRDVDIHVHRIGRIGRAGDKDGTAYTLITMEEAQFVGRRNVVPSRSTAVLGSYEFSPVIIDEMVSFALIFDPGGASLEPGIKIANKVNADILCFEGSKERIRSLFNKVEFFVSSYDTSGVSMVPSSHYSQAPCFPGCVNWILDNQLYDGSWGLPQHSDPLLKDAFSSKLACILTLRRWGVGEKQINKGLHFLELNFDSVIDKNQHAPIGFDIIFSGMLEYAKTLNLKLSLEPTIWDVMLRKRALELRKCIESHSLESESYSTNVSEGMENLQNWKMVMKYQRKNGSLFNSPSTTVVALNHLQNADCLNYLRFLLE